MRTPKSRGLASRLLLVSACVASTSGCATDGVYDGGDLGAGRFTQIGRPPGARSRPSEGAVADIVPGRSVEDAGRRVEAFLAQAGFQPESVSHAGLYVISGDRMASAAGGDAPKADAVCELKALERPRMYTTHVDVRLGPASAAEGSSGGRVRMGVEVKVVELDANLLSGALSKQTCHSRGALESALRRAAFGG